MPLDIDPSTPIVGNIEIALYMSADGVDVAYGLEGVSPEAAIGYLIVVSDRLREERKYEWDTCPDCKRPWSEHGEDDESIYDQDEDDELLA